MPALGSSGIDPIGQTPRVAEGQNDTPIVGVAVCFDQMGRGE